LRLLEEMREKRQSPPRPRPSLKMQRISCGTKREPSLKRSMRWRPKRAVKAFSLYELDEGRPRGGGAEGKRNRAQVLDRLARLGQGISPAQRNDFAWFKDAWDSTNARRARSSLARRLCRLGAASAAGTRRRRQNRLFCVPAQRNPEMLWRGGRTRAAVRRRSCGGRSAHAGEEEAAPQHSGRSCGPGQGF